MARMRSSGNMRNSMVVVLSMMSMVLMTGCTAASDCEEVLDLNGEKVLYGRASSFALRDVEDDGQAYPCFFFELGETGQPVCADSELVIGTVLPGENRILECQSDGHLIFVPYTLPPSPQSLVRVRYNVTDTYYRLAITDTPNTFLHTQTFGTYDAIGCLPGVPGNRYQFDLSYAADCSSVPAKSKSIASS